ncbi:helix-turn-helix domain-containing protein [Streptomyces sp. NPDC096205]|uniref:MmyB family transcriptional regulator n=1 Tax=Streptomyces sp. NPDC096205 TaxID=3366081 RepID=UPI003815C68A
MDNREEVREFLTSRRAEITPERAGLPAGSRRRVAGLRRSEVAAPADMSVEYYAKPERGSLAGVSPAVLEAVARALRLDDAERAHLLHPAQAADGSDALTRPRRRAGRQWTPHRSLQRFRHPAVGDLTLAHEGLEMAADPGPTLTVYTAEPGSPSEEGLRLLASWAATQEAGPPPQPTRS